MRLLVMWITVASLLARSACEYESLDRDDGCTVTGPNEPPVHTRCILRSSMSQGVPLLIVKRPTIEASEFRIQSAISTVGASRTDRNGQARRTWSISLPIEIRRDLRQKLRNAAPWSRHRISSRPRDARQGMVGRSHIAGTLPAGRLASGTPPSVHNAAPHGITT